MGSKRTLVAVSALIVALALAAYFVRPPGPGQFYHYRSSQYGLAGSTALVLRNGECLVLSRSEEDIGKVAASEGTAERLYVIAGTGRIASGSDERGPYLRDGQGNLARPGDAIDAEIVFKLRGAEFGDTLAAGWPIRHDCGRGLAVVFSIDRVHR